MRVFTFTVEEFDEESGNLTKKVEVVDADSVTISDVGELFVRFLQAQRYPVAGIDLVLGNVEEENPDDAE